MEFPTSEGVLLSGWYLPARDGAAVALLHGSGSTRTDVLAQAEVLSHNGFGVLMFDARGHGPRGAFQYGLDHLMTFATDVLTDASPPATLRESAGLAAPRPVLLITAGAVPDETLAAEFIQGGSPATVHVWDVPGGGHSGGLATDPAGWEHRVTGFLDAALR